MKRTRDTADHADGLHGGWPSGRLSLKRRRISDQQDDTEAPIKMTLGTDGAQEDELALLMNGEFIIICENAIKSFKRTERAVSIQQARIASLDRTLLLAIEGREAAGLAHERIERKSRLTDNDRRKLASIVEEGEKWHRLIEDAQNHKTAAQDRLSSAYRSLLESQRRLISVLDAVHLGLWETEPETPLGAADSEAASRKNFEAPLPPPRTNGEDEHTILGGSASGLQRSLLPDPQQMAAQTLRDDYWDCKNAYIYARKNFKAQKRLRDEEYEQAQADIRYKDLPIHAAKTMLDVAHLDQRRRLSRNITVAEKAWAAAKEAARKAGVVVQDPRQTSQFASASTATWAPDEVYTRKNDTKINGWVDLAPWGEVDGVSEFKAVDPWDARSLEIGEDLQTIAKERSRRKIDEWNLIRLADAQDLPYIEPMPQSPRYITRSVSASRR